MLGSIEDGVLGEKWSGEVEEEEGEKNKGRRRQERRYQRSTKPETWGSTENNIVTSIDINTQAERQKNKKAMGGPLVFVKIFRGFFSAQDI